MTNLEKQKIISEYLSNFDLKEAELKEINLVNYKKNSEIYSSYDYANLQIIVKGQMEVCTMNEGELKTIDYIFKNDLFGDIEYFTKSTSIHTLICLEDCLVLVIPYSLIDKSLVYNSKFNYFLAKNLAYKLEKTSRSKAKLLSYSTKKLVINHILEQKSVFKISNTTLAKSLGVTSRHITRTIKLLIEEKTIKRISRSTYEIIDKDLLIKLLDKDN